MPAAIADTTRPSASHNKMAWARDALTRAKLTQRDLAREWNASESTVSRWLDGFQASDLPVSRAMAFANLVRMSCCEMMTLLGHPPNVAAEEQRPVTPENTPPIPTVRMTPARSGKWHLLLHLELSAQAIARIVATLEQMGRNSPTSPPPPLKGTNTSLSARAVTAGAP